MAFIIMTEDQFIHLIQRFHNRQLSDEELVVFLQAAEDPRFEALIGAQLYAELAQIQAAPISDARRAEKVWHTVNAAIKGTSDDVQEPLERNAAKTISYRNRPLKQLWLRYAAAILILFGIGSYLWTSKSDKQQNPVAVMDVAPGSEGAILTLADGSKILLDSLNNGRIALEKGTEVLLKDGSLMYNTIEKNNATSYNTMTTPRGRQFSIQLPDGSKAWLNAASSISYPTTFTTSERSVSVSGEVYFEIKQDAKKPFVVKVNNENTIRVLGTRFNVKAYMEDAVITTTLVEGAVLVQAYQHLQKLSPGQQAQAQPDGQLKFLPQVDVSKIMAWKNGYFNFQDETLEEGMKQLERWYDIQVKYIGTPPQKKFFGELQRDLSLSEVIASLRDIGVRCKMEGRTLLVMP